jgi:predicted XRE-type DNA-binding protein
VVSLALATISTYMNRTLKAHIRELKAKMKARDREVKALKERAKKVFREHSQEMSKVLKEIGIEVRKCIDEGKMKDYQFANEIDLPQAVVSKLTKGEYMFGEDSLAKLEAWAEK